MCLILFAHKAHPGYPLILAANRDEAYSRAAAPADDRVGERPADQLPVGEDGRDDGHVARVGDRHVPGVERARGDLALVELQVQAVEPLLVLVRQVRALLADEVLVRLVKRLPVLVELGVADIDVEPVRQGHLPELRIHEGRLDDLVGVSPDVDHAADGHAWSDQAPELDRAARVPLAAQIAGYYAKVIHDGRMRGGDRLPPIREIARACEVTRATVQDAYRQLAKKGLVEGTVGRGTTVLGADAKVGAFVRIDMEHSHYTAMTLEIFETLWEQQYRNLGVALQAYLFRTEQDVRRMNVLGARVRLGKGAYKEPAAIAYTHKSDVDAAFIRLARLLLDEGT